MDEEPSEPRGPWIFEDDGGRRYLLQLVPLEHDPTVAASKQPRAAVFQTDEGWIRVSPVGHDFSPESLTREEIQRILRHLDSLPLDEPAA